MVNNFEVSVDQLDPTTAIRVEDYVLETPAMTREEIFLAEIGASEELLDRIDVAPARVAVSLRTCREAKQLRKTVQLMRDYIRAKEVINP